MILNIEQERIKRGWTRQYVANQIGITAESIRLLELAQRKPSYEVLVRLEDLFGESHRDLFAVANDGSNLSK